MKVNKDEMKEMTLNEYAIHLYSESNLSEMEKVRKFAEKQWEEQMDCTEMDLIYLDHDGVSVVYPWTDDSGRFDVDPIKEYGVTAFYDFYSKIIQRMENIYLQDSELSESRDDEAEPDL